MLDSLLIVLALVWAATCLVVGVRACAARETVGNVRRGGASKSVSIMLAELLRGDSGWQWFALGAAWARHVMAPVPALVPARAPVVTRCPGGPPRMLRCELSALCGWPGVMRGGPRDMRGGPRDMRGGLSAENRFALTPPASD